MVAEDAGVSPKDVGEGIKEEEKAGKKLDEDKRSAAIFLQGMSGPQKNTRLKAEKREKYKR